MFPNILIQGDSEVDDGVVRIRNFWTIGPVHMNQEGYSCLAENIVNSILEVKHSKAN
jgi:hypothetical protein